MNDASESSNEQPVTTELRAIKRSSGEWDIEDSIRGDQQHTLVLTVIGPKRVSAPGLLTDEAFGVWVKSMRDEGYRVALADLDGNPPHFDV
jgi:hypothetical protein